jgi:hypothetical protein
MLIQHNPGGILVRGMYMTVTCSESVPFITRSDIAGTEHTFVGSYRITSHIAACRGWPRGDVGKDFIRPVRSDSPAARGDQEFGDIVAKVFDAYETFK